jgi:hypothetical protein
MEVSERASVSVAYALFLELEPVDDSAEVVPQVQLALGLDAREYAALVLCRHRLHLTTHVHNNSVGDQGGGGRGRG